MPQGVMEGGRLKIAIAFEPEVFHRLRLEAEDRGASFSDHVAWLVQRCWRLDRENQDRKASEERLAQALREKERKTRNLPRPR